MPKALCALSLFLFFFSDFCVGQGLPDLTGTWVGKRYQFDDAQQNYIQVFTYLYDLKQVNNMVSGISYIKNDEGKDAEIAIRGVVLGEKFYFEEYQVIRAERPDGKIWCFKKGELTMVQNKASWMLSGETPSFTEDFGLPCSGGVSYLTKLSDCTDADPTAEDIAKIVSSPGQSVITSYPNPFVTSTMLSIRLEEAAHIQADVLDITGRVIKELYKGEKAAGYHPIPCEIANNGQESRILIVRVKIGDSVYTKNLIQQLF